MIRSLLAAGAAALTLFGTGGASADPLGLTTVSLGGGGLQRCSQRSLSYQGRVAFGPDGIIPGNGRTVAIKVDGEIADYATADADGRFDVDLAIGPDGDHSVTATVFDATPLVTTSEPVAVTVTDSDYWKDQDGDGFGAGDPVCFDQPPVGWAEDGGDCDDLAPDVNPSEPDLTVDGIDQNCDGIDGS